MWRRPSQSADDGDEQPSTSAQGSDEAKEKAAKEKAAKEKAAKEKAVVRAENISLKSARFAEAETEEQTVSSEQDDAIKFLRVRRQSRIIQDFRPTSYIETLIHLLKGNIGSGMMAMGYAFYNGGLCLSPVLTLFLAIVCIHAQHQLVTAAAAMKFRAEREHTPNFANTVEFAFALGPPRVRKYAPHIRAYVLFTLCVTQLGFCCAYIVFIANSLIKILEFFEVDLHLNKADTYLVMVAAILLPILLTCWIRDLKFLVPFSLLANLLMIFGIVATLYYMAKDLSLEDLRKRKYVASYTQLPLYLGTTVYSFEGISLVLPLQKQMKEETQFGSRYGVLNVGMTIVTLLLIVVGTIGYARYGEKVEGSLNLNLPQKEIVPLCINIAIAAGVLFTYALMMHVPVLIVVPALLQKWKIERHPIFVETIIRTLLVLLTFVLAALVPHLELVIALVGSVASTSLALLIPSMLDTVVHWESGITKFTIVKNMLIFVFGLMVFFAGTAISLMNIVESIRDEFS